FRTSDLQVGTHTIVLEAVDVSGLKASDSLELTINTPPDTPQVDITPSPATSADDLTARILSSSDADGDALTYSYTWIRNGVVESQTASTSATEDSLIASDTAVGDTWTVQVFASDAYSQSDVVELSVEVVNSPPTITDAEIAPATAYNDSVLTCSATVADIDQAITPTYTWSVGSDTYTGASLDLGFLSVMPNESVTCSIEATDNNGSSVSMEAGISIANRDPQISSIVLQPSTGIVADSTVECVVTATDPDGETPIVSHSWSNGGALGTSNPLTLDPSVVSRGETLSCTGTATDGYGGTDSSSVSADIENSQPQIASFSLLPSAPTVDEVVTCSFTASDIDGDTLTAQFSWDNQDTGQNYTSTSASGLTSTLDLGTVSIQGSETLSCSVTVSDGHGLQDTASQSVIVQNEGPTFTVEAEISPGAGVYIGTELSCHAEATDSEDGVSTVVYSWSSAGTVLGTGAAYTVSSTDVAVGDTITCTATAEDSLGASSTSEASLVVENTAPQLSSVSISPDPLYNTDLATCSATVTDPDETLVPSYVWTLGGQIVGTSADLQLDTSLSSPFDSLECSVSVTDSSGIFVDDAATVILGNRSPSAPSVRISPTTPVVQDDLLCVIDTASLDADGDTVAYTYVWEKSGVIQASYSTDTIPSSELDYGDTWTCTVTPTDGSDVGSSSSASVSIQDACSNTDCDLTVLFPNGTGIDFVLIPGGSFAMGSPSGETGRKSDETLHNVTLTNNFYMMTTEMNQVMFETLMGYNPGSFASCGVECPVEMVSWYEAAHFANELTTYFNDEWGTTLDQCYSCNFNSAGVLSSCTAAVSPVYDCNGFRLPTEAEWEYAARAESTTAFDTPNGGGNFDDPTYILNGCGSTTLDEGTSLDDMAWYCSNSASSVQVMASKEPNSWGLYDMHGNIAEWCHDWYDNKFGMSTVGAATDPEGATTGSQKVIRGGYWSNPPQRTRSAARASYNPSAQFNSYGFRLVMTEW
ncbi:MAG: SUMF1/EgtB/PvdO family nonheme iron enzyme, partial [Myxococcota bacterium]|nr:SUMF1/EgtB/PvdO family nonheme iron enzyme [Myxococcota bacterium]